MHRAEIGWLLPNEISHMPSLAHHVTPFNPCNKLEVICMFLRVEMWKLWPANMSLGRCPDIQSASLHVPTWFVWLFQEAETDLPDVCFFTHDHLGSRPWKLLEKGLALDKKHLAGDWTYHLSIIIYHGLPSFHAPNHQQFLNGTLIGPNHSGLGTNGLLGSLTTLVLSPWSWLREPAVSQG